MEQFFIKGTNDELFVTFHGQGGYEYSLLFITSELNPFSNIITYLGNYNKGDRRRFFKPIKDGKRDIVDFEERINKFLENWNTIDLTNYKKITFIGYSNGANFILGLLEKNPDIADKTILLHPSDLHWDFTKKATKNKILATVGSQDIISNPGKILNMQKQYSKTIFPTFDIKLLDSGHEVRDDEVDVVKEWYLSN
ncbi:alpha/beta hydrolase [Gemelliphila palaticanis]|uniref:Phospholipase n=1 Tax=Gemelliphila palaticanis TaxID=81950 RepID=A0ABX2T184_9BACL|nr:phospholipase [Gemella palaticanis]MBF0715467.1 phospholipase [Gemella palaticanis]NYS47397.1 phospholipase [Gemella palaticanis]